MKDKAKICKVWHWIWKWLFLILLCVIVTISCILSIWIGESLRANPQLSVFTKEAVIVGTVVQAPIKLGPGIYVISVNLLPDDKRVIQWALVSEKYSAVRGQKVKVQKIFIHESNQGYSEEVLVIQNE